MKAIFTKFLLPVFLFTGLSSGVLFAQKQKTDSVVYSNANYSLRRWDFGFNMGATWLKSDLDKNYARLGWGFTLGKYWLRNSHKVFDVGLRFRYLMGNARGLDYHRNYDIKYNTALNGTLYPKQIKYDSVPGYVYNNYQMISNELSMELMLGLNRLRQNTGILFYVFGGGGFFYSKTTINQLNAEGKMYDYSKIDPTSGKDAILNTLNSGFLDNTYETKAEGKNNDGWVICPTLGIGIGKMLSKSTAIGLEHKITFPLHSYLDGQQWAANNTASPNDWQHYTGFYLRWYFISQAEINSHTYTQQTTDYNQYTYNNGNTNTGTGTATGNANPPPTVARPYITISYPTGSPYTHSSSTITVTGTVQNVNSKDEIKVKVNGQNQPYFNYNPVTHVISINTNLNQGTNTVDIYASNQGGSDHKAQNIIFNDFGGAPPLITFTYPGSNPYNSSSGNVNVTATVTNVASQSNIFVNYNGQPVHNFTYDPNSKIFTYPAVLNNGGNTLTISATNSYGSDSKTMTMNMSMVNNLQKPIVTITNPAANPYTVTNNICPVYATVLNVESQNGISITANGQPVSIFNYNPGSKALTFSVNMKLQPSVNVVIMATNPAGSDAKSVTLIQAPRENPPVVTITNPSGNPAAALTSAQQVNATITNIFSASQASVTLNGSPVSNFNYFKGQLNFTANLNSGLNTVVISATNNAGTDTKSLTISYQPKMYVPKPSVIITNPASNPYTTNNPALTLAAMVTGVNSQNEITVTVNNSPVGTFNYDLQSQTLQLNASLNPGNNIITVSASNQGGSDSKSETVTYVPEVIAPPVVTITYPASNPYIVNDSYITITATVLNVSSQSQINVTALGNAPVPFSFNPSSHIVTFGVTLGANANPFTVLATNQAGSDSKSVTIKYVSNSGTGVSSGHGDNGGGGSNGSGNGNSSGEVGNPRDGNVPNNGNGNSSSGTGVGTGHGNNGNGNGTGSGETGNPRDGNVPNNGGSSGGGKGNLLLNILNTINENSGKNPPPSNSGNSGSSGGSNTPVKTWGNSGDAPAPKDQGSGVKNNTPPPPPPQNNNGGKSDAPAPAPGNTTPTNTPPPSDGGGGNN